MLDDVKYLKPIMNFEALIKIYGLSKEHRIGMVVYGACRRVDDNIFISISSAADGDLKVAPYARQNDRTTREAGIYWHSFASDG